MVIVKQWYWFMVMMDDGVVCDVQCLFVTVVIFLLLFSWFSKCLNLSWGCQCMVAWSAVAVLFSIINLYYVHQAHVTLAWPYRAFSYTYAKEHEIVPNSTLSWALHHRLYISIALGFSLSLVNRVTNNALVASACLLSMSSMFRTKRGSYSSTNEWEDCTSILRAVTQLVRLISIILQYYYIIAPIYMDRFITSGRSWYQRAVRQQTLAKL